LGLSGERIKSQLEKTGGQLGSLRGKKGRQRGWGLLGWGGKGFGFQKTMGQEQKGVTD